MSFGEAVKKLRQDAGFSEQKVAKKLGTTVESYQMLEDDRREATMGELYKLADLYKISTLELVAEEGEDWPGVFFSPAPIYSPVVARAHRTHRRNEQEDDAKKARQ